jgi:preprotein translocase subunit SecG
MFWTDTFIVVLLIGYVVVSLLMCLVVLMQRSKQEGLGAAFGGGFTDSVFGAQTSQVLVKTTVWLAIFFFIFSIALARLYSHRAALAGAGGLSPLQSRLLHPVAPPLPATNAAGSAVVPTETPMIPAAANPISTNAPAAPLMTNAAPVSAPPAK